jgi:hypothetical protein
MKTGVSEDPIASINKVRRIGELGTALAVTSYRSSVLQLLVSANIVPSSPIILTLMMEAASSSEKSVLTRATKLHIQEDGILRILTCSVSNQKVENLRNLILF